MVLSILSLNASAEILAEMPNEGGGKIVLLDKDCTTKNTWVAYSYLASGHSIIGCWAAAGDRIFIDWGKNDIRSYSAAGFTLSNPAPKKKYM